MFRSDSKNWSCKTNNTWKQTRRSMGDFSCQLLIQAIVILMIMDLLVLTTKNKETCLKIEKSIFSCSLQIIWLLNLNNFDMKSVLVNIKVPFNVL